MIANSGATTQLARLRGWPAGSGPCHRLRGHRRLIIPVLASALIVTGCSAGDRETGPTDTGQPVPTLTMAIGGDERALTPFNYTTGSTGIPLLSLIYDTLMVLDTNNVPQPLLATGMEVSAEGTRYRLPLREQVRWHDGQPFSPADVTFSVEYYKAHPTNLTAGLTKVQSASVDGSAVVFTLTGPSPDFVTATLAGMPVLPAHLWRDVADPKSVTQAVGTGPYKLVEYTAKQRYRLIANLDYALGAPVARELLLPIINEPTTAFAALQRGEVDAVAQGVPPQLVEQFRSDSNLRLAAGPGFSSTMLQFNNERPPFTRVEVRRAVAMAIDVDELVRTVLLGAGVPASAGYLPAAAPLNATAIPHRYDPAEANRLLDELGYPRGADGIRVADGQPMTHTLLCYADQPDRIRAAELIAEMLTRIGVTAQVQTLDMAAVDDRVWPEFDVSKGRDFDLAMWGWSAPVAQTTNRFGGLVHSDLSRGFLNIGGFRSPEADQLVDALDRAATADEARTVVGQLQALIADQRPFVPLYYENETNAFRPASYDRWQAQTGQGILNKLSFVRLNPA